MFHMHALVHTHPHTWTPGGFLPHHCFTFISFHLPARERQRQVEQSRQINVCRSICMHEEETVPVTHGTAMSTALSNRHTTCVHHSAYLTIYTSSCPLKDTNPTHHTHCMLCTCTYTMFLYVTSNCECQLLLGRHIGVLSPYTCKSHTALHSNECNTWKQQRKMTLNINRQSSIY